MQTVLKIRKRSQRSRKKGHSAIIVCACRTSHCSTGTSTSTHHSNKILLWAWAARGVWGKRAASAASATAANGVHSSLLVTRHQPQPLSLAPASRKKAFLKQEKGGERTPNTDAITHRLDNGAASVCVQKQLLTSKSFVMLNELCMLLMHSTRLMSPVARQWPLPGEFS